MSEKRGKSDKEVADELDARDRLKARGAVWMTCRACEGLSEIIGYCPSCQGNGGRWSFPLERIAS